MRSVLTVFLICAAPLLSCAVEPEIAEPTEPTKPIGVFVEEPCPVPIPEGLIEGESVRCGTIAVPEFHADPDGKTLTLRAAVFPSIGEDPSPSPLFVATAGPGASGIESITPEVAGPLGAALLSSRDLVLIDYRGLPLATPQLMCPEIIDAGFRSLDRTLSGEDFMAAQLVEAAACRDRLRNEGVTLEAFSNAETATERRPGRSSLSICCGIFRNGCAASSSTRPCRPDGAMSISKLPPWPPRLSMPLLVFASPMPLALPRIRT